jgi:hypothetical protein
MKAEPVPKRRRAHYYWWTLANVVAACVAILSWLFCLHLFGHPEIPQNYRILQQLGRAQPAPDLGLQEIPAGEISGPQSLYARYAEADPKTLERLNRALMRNYLTELKEPGLIEYLEGDFEILEVETLTAGDFFGSGLRLRARAMVRSDEFSDPAPWPVTLDYLLPSPEPITPPAIESGGMLQLSKVPHAALVLHVARHAGRDTTRVHLTAVPLAMGEHPLGPDATLHLVAPSTLDPGARFPEPPAVLPAGPTE